MVARRQRTRVPRLAHGIGPRDSPQLSLACLRLPFSFEASSNWSCGLEAPFAIINSEEDDSSHGSGNRPPTAYSLACVQKDNAFCLLQNSSIIQSTCSYSCSLSSSPLRCRAGLTSAFYFMWSRAKRKAFREHRADITCFASSKNVVVSGSKDTCVIVWNVISSPSTKRIDPTPRHILRAHGISQPTQRFTLLGPALSVHVVTPVGGIRHVP